LRVFKNRVLGKIFEPEREEGRSWTKLHNYELHSLYSSPNNVRVIKRWVGHVACMWERRGVYMVLFGRPEGKRPLEGPRHQWEENMKIDLRKIGINVAKWFLLAQGRV
jgi:hypothetical protein